MPKSNPLRLVVALSTAMMFALPGAALAQKAAKKITYEEAFRRCKAFMDEGREVLERVDLRMRTRRHAARRA